MNDDTTTGYLFLFSRGDLAPPGGRRNLHFIAVADDVNEARDLVSLLGVEPVDLQLIGSGSEILIQARQLGVRPGTAKAL